MFTIGQFSKIRKVSAKALRHYDKIGLLSSAKVEEGNQYRYYTSEQIPLLKKIIFFKELGIPLKTIKQIVRGKKNSTDISSLLEEHRRFLLRELDLCNSRLFKLAWWQKQESRPGSGLASDR